DPLAVQLEDHAEDTVGRGVLGTDVEDHLLGPEWAFDHDVDPAATKHPRVAGRRVLGSLPDVHRSKGSRGLRYGCGRFLAGAGVGRAALRGRPALGSGPRPRSTEGQEA